MKYLKHTVLDDRVELLTDQGLLALMPLTDSILRCVYTRRGQVLPGSFLVEPLACAVAFSVEDTAEAVTVAAGGVAVAMDKAAGALTWRRPGGEVLLREPARQLQEIEVVRYREGGELALRISKTVDGDRMYNQNLVPYVDRTAYQGKLVFEFEDGEPLYGLGQAEEGIYNCRGRSQFLYQNNMRIPIPYMLSGKNYGVFFDCGSTMYFSDDYNGSYMWMRTIEQMDTYFVTGDCLDDLVAGFRTISGRAAMLPRWAFGYMQSRETYTTQRELVEVTAECRRRNIPLDCVIQDWKTWKADLWGDKVTDKARYPDLPAAIDELHAMQVHAMVSVWPNMNAGGENHAEFEEKGWLLADHATYDPFNEGARKLYWEQANRELFRAGFDAWWCDSSEGFCRTDWNGEFRREPWVRYEMVSEELARHLDPAVANTFCVMHAKTIWDGQRAATDEKRVVKLTRSGYPSAQKLGTILWSGDTSAKWSALRAQVAEGLRFCMSGMPYWTMDIGAFFVSNAEGFRSRPGNEDMPADWFRDGDYNGGVADPAYRELYTRWLQYGAFLPVFRSHGTDTPREIWQFGEEGNIFYDSIAKFIRLRHTLIPYLYSLGARCCLEHYTMLRGLAFDFPDDAAVQDMGDEFMLGPAFLVCPVLRPMYYEAGGREMSGDKTRACYLPAGANWYDFWDGTYYSGGQTVTVPAPIDRMPLFVRAGSIVPMTETAQYADQAAALPLEIHIWPGTDGSFTLYGDSGDGYGYERGEYRLTTLRWDNSTQTLIVSACGRGWSGMPLSCPAVAVVHGDKDRRISFSFDDSVERRLMI